MKKKEMKGREVGRARGNGRNPTADLLVCFPSQAHLTLMPKPICSPSRSSTEPSKRHHHHHQRSRGQASPLFRTKPDKANHSEISEPTSPKVTCAGQIKVRPKSNSSAASCKNWQSVMEEIERIHNSGHRKSKRKPTWLDSVGFKKDIMQFLTALRSLRFDLRCFGSFHGSVVDSDTDEEEEEEEEEEDGDEQVEEGGSSPSRTIFSKWFMVLQENQSAKEAGGEEMNRSDENRPVAAPPPNALLLMRCRSAPAKGWLDRERRGAEEVEENKEREEQDEKEILKKVLEEEKKKEKLVLMSYAPDFFKVSSDIAKETWVVGRRDPFSRSRSWKR